MTLRRNRLVRHVRPKPRLFSAPAVASADATVALPWAFNQVMVRLHHAHAFHAAACCGAPAGLAFLNDPAQDDGDYFLFAAIVGASGRTADVAFDTGLP